MSSSIVAPCCGEEREERGPVRGVREGGGEGGGVREGGRGDTNFSEFVEEEEGDHRGGCESGAEGDICEDGERLGREGGGGVPTHRT